MQPHTLTSLWRSCLVRRRVNEETGCWLSTYKLTHNGYAQASLQGRTVRVHRVAMAIKIAVSIDTLDSFCDDSGYQLTVDHLCRTPLCFRPDHLELVPIRINVLRGETITAANSVRTACPRGHRLIGVNLVPSGIASGRRQCLTCSRVRSVLNTRRRRGMDVPPFSLTEHKIVAAMRGAGHGRG